MPPRPAEGLSQVEVLLRLRYAIDTALKYPSAQNTATALSFANAYPRAIRSSHVRANLGGRRWDWLGQHGIYPVGEGGEIEGSFKGTITPDVIKEVNQ